ncbi:MAG: PEP-CTERM sorting domain-containing protein [Proteobacteria bacterium]|nr:PEP-CTERM sorting domain-containing protein [Pseudomonadota bacterium]
MKQTTALARAVAIAVSGLTMQLAHGAAAWYDLGAGRTVTGASANGGVAAAYDGARYYVWTPAGGVKSIGGRWESGVASVSGDGTLVSGSTVGADGNTQAAVYTVATGRWTALGGIGGASGTSESSAWAMAGNGQSIVGLGWVDAGTAHAVQSTPAGILHDLGSLGGSSRANGVNADGSMVVGWQELANGFWQGTYWRNGVATLMFDEHGAELSEANAVSADGTWVVGDALGGQETWRYNTQTSTIQYLGDLDPSGDQQAATGISADGRVIVGYDRNSGPPQLGTGSIWIEGLGMLNLTDYAESQGIDLHGRTLALPMGVSADGTTVYGLDSARHGFVVTLAPIPEPGTYALFGIGLIGVMVARRRARTAA